MVGCKGEKGQSQWWVVRVKRDKVNDGTVRLKRDKVSGGL